jgi:hypothetical protein
VLRELALQRQSPASYRGAEGTGLTSVRRVDGGLLVPKHRYAARTLSL